MIYRLAYIHNQLVFILLNKCTGTILSEGNMRELFISIGILFYSVINGNQLNNPGMNINKYTYIIDDNIVLVNMSVDKFGN